jgi:hypothetical protein
MELQVRDNIHSTNYAKAFFADWLRLALLEKFGGIWMDSSIFLNDPLYLSMMHAEANANPHCEVAGFQIPIDEFQTRSEYPVIENWMILAPPNSKFVTSWRTEHLKALRIGFDAYRLFVEDSSFDPQLIYKHSGTYLTQHVCAQVAMQSRSDLPSSYAMLRNALTGPLSMQADCTFSTPCIALHMKMETYRMRPIVKIRGFDRTLGTAADIIVLLLTLAYLYMFLRITCKRRGCSL